MSTSSTLQMFRAMNTDGTSGISLKEFKSTQGLGSSSLRQYVGKSSAGAVFKEWDTDKSGSLSANEFSDGLARVSSDVASVVLAAQEQENKVSQMLNGVKVGLYNTLNASSTSNSSLVYGILSAYYLKGV